MTEVEKLLAPFTLPASINELANMKLSTINNKSLEQIYQEKGIEPIKDYLDRLFSYIPGVFDDFVEKWNI